METFERIATQIESHPVYKMVLADSCGGIMYDVANHGKYNATEVLNLWAAMPASEREAAGGIMQGAIAFLQGK